MTSGWCLRVVGVSALGAIASLIIGGFVILFVGIAVLAVFNGGSTHGNVDHAVWLASVVVGPLIVGTCTGGLAAITHWPQRALKRRTVIAEAIASAVTSAALLGGHTNGSIRFLVQPQWWVIYRFGVTALTYLIVAITGVSSPVDEVITTAGPMSGPMPGWFPDPFAQAKWRWWDGTQWTHHEAD